MESKTLTIWSMEKSSCIKQEEHFGWKPQQITETGSASLNVGSILRIEFIRETDFPEYQELRQLEGRYQTSTAYKDYEASLLQWTASNVSSWNKALLTLLFYASFFLIIWGLKIAARSLTGGIPCILIGTMLLAWRIKKYQNSKQDEKEIKKRLRGNRELSQLEIEDILNRAAICLSKQCTGSADV